MLWILQNSIKVNVCSSIYLYLCPRFINIEIHKMYYNKERVNVTYLE